MGIVAAAIGSGMYPGCPNRLTAEGEMGNHEKRVYQNRRKRYCRFPPARPPSSHRLVQIP